MNIYTSLKYQLSDAICTVLPHMTVQGFATYCSRFIDGFFVTIELLSLSCLFGFGIALVVVIAQTSRYILLALCASGYSYVFRGTPLLVQLWIVYFGLGFFGAESLGIFWPLVSDGWTVGLLILTLNTAAYVAEILRGGIANVDKGQREAAQACGMSRATTMRRIILPQAIRIVWPAYGNEIILLMKGSALVSTITVLDLMGQTRTVFSRNYSLDVYLYAAVLYLILAGLITLVCKIIEKRWQY